MVSRQKRNERWCRLEKNTGGKVCKENVSLVLCVGLRGDHLHLERENGTVWRLESGWDCVRSLDGVNGACTDKGTSWIICHGHIPVLELGGAIYRRQDSIVS